MTGTAMAHSGISHAVLVPRLREFRMWAALSQEDLALRAGVSRVTIARAEQGMPIRPSNVRKIARALRVSPRELQQPSE